MVAHPKVGVNEAYLLRDFLLTRGVPEQAVITEPKAAHTGLNITLSVMRLKEIGIIPKQAVLISHSFAAARVMATAEAQWPFPKPTFYSQAVMFPFHRYLARSKRVGWEHVFLRSILGEYERLFYRGYAENGLIKHRETCKDVDAAYHRLAACGHIIR